MASPKTLEWREKNKDFIQQWQVKMKELRLMEQWNPDKLEMEITQCIDHQTLKDIFIFAKNYIARYKSGHFRKLMFEAYNEIIQYGTLEPHWILFLIKRIKVARRKMRWE